ncbi:acyl-CoA dehydrogenase family protein [Rhodococcus wratislaviensis]|uniref:Putative acyl-CoA dehydrogenase n=1 Tax=Rhodococcus wratislaviensis NBRC 100605 TaxID=1219028 RepID=X0PXI3_RHOWR|nr:acyl-CoA dehydrogenase family protein [Rhodococcus wratislaviensis]GAF43037.1 putative acyl-CoA dehydrogenase [Rhodococcus wratislaviensis NBRC 100605]
MPELAGDRAFLGEDQLELRRTIQAFLGKHVDESAVRRQVETADRFDRAVWARMTTELGLPALAVPEERGGFGATALEVAVVAEELGAALAPQPFLPVVLAAAGLATLDDRSSTVVLESIVDGGVVAVVPPPTAVGASRGSQSVRVLGTGDTARLTGKADFVISGAQADRFLVYTDRPEGPLLVTLTTGDGVTVQERTCLDNTRPQACLVFDDVPATVLASGPESAAAWSRAQRWGLLVLAAGEAGVARRCLEMSVEYGGVRKQFGRLIGSHQAIKHRCTDMLIALDLARAAVRDAAIAVRDERPDAGTAVHQARYLAQQAAEFATRECIQVHGGIGFTWEHPAHLYYKRARADAAVLGSSTDQLDAFAALTLQTPSRSRT